MINKNINLKFFIKTFGCQANEADGQRIAVYLKRRGMTESKILKEADYVVINSCIVRESAENRIYGLINNLKNNRKKSGKPKKIILSGCLAGLLKNDKSGKLKRIFRKRLKDIDEILPIDEVGFDNIEINKSGGKALVPITSGCNNLCSYCIVPFSRGREISRPFDEIINECEKYFQNGYKQIMLLGQNVNSYGSDVIKYTDIQIYKYAEGKKIKINIEPVYVKYLGKKRIPTLFPYLLDEVSKIGFKKVEFMSSNPWDFSDKLIEIIKINKNISRIIHLPVQSGDDEILRKMNRWYTREEYLNLIKKIRKEIPKVRITTDIIVGFPGETKQAFENTVKLCKKAKFDLAYISQYSERPFTVSSKMKDDVSHEEKERRWKKLNSLIN